MQVTGIPWVPKVRDSCEHVGAPLCTLEGAATVSELTPSYPGSGSAQVAFEVTFKGSERSGHF